MQNQIKSKPDEYWPSHIESWRDSGLSQMAYCQQEALNYKTFHYHLRRLKAKASSPELTFIETKAVVQSALLKKAAQTLNMRLVLRNGVSIALDEMPANLLLQVLETASSISC